jgi:hypothetical protein
VRTGNTVTVVTLPASALRVPPGERVSHLVRAAAIELGGLDDAAETAVKLAVDGEQVKSFVTSRNAGTTRRYEPT